MLKVLIADDHQVVRTALRSLIENACGAMCIEAVNGVDAIVKAAEFEPDVIVLDLSMPEMDGLEAAQLLKTTIPGVPMFLLTSYHEPEVEAAAYNAGITRVFSKGESLKTFVSLINEILVAGQQSSS